MGDLTYRAERALLGAMIADPGLAARLSARYLERGDFTDSLHRSLYTVIHAFSVAGTMTGSAWSEAIVLAGGPEVSERYLDELVAACPDPSHGAAYGALVAQARVHREMFGHAAHLASQARLLRHDSRRLTRIGGAGGLGADVLARHLDDVASAMRHHAVEFGPAAVSTAEMPSGTATSEAAGGPEQARLEERVLAAVIQQHPASGQILRFLPTAAFTDPIRRQVFLAARRLRGIGRPVDELTIDWELASEQAPSSQQPAETATAPDDSDSYVTRLARASIGDDPPLKTADALLARLHETETRPRTADPPRHQRPAHSIPAQAPASPRPDLSPKPPRLASPDHRPEQRM
jgi:hypothetical protein